MRPLTPVRDTGLLLTRVLLAVIVLAHAWQKFALMGIDGTTAFFTKVGAPLPALTAPAVIGLETVTGIMLLLGAFTPIAGLLIAADMLGAFALVHLPNGIFAADGGWELVALIGLAAVTFALVGPGRFSVDHLLTDGRGRAHTATPGPHASGGRVAPSTH